MREHFLFLVVAFTLQLNPRSKRYLPSATFWTSRRNMCLPSSPRVHAFIFIAHRVQHSDLSAFYARRFHRLLRTHALVLSARQILRKEKSLHRENGIYITATSCYYYSFSQLVHGAFFSYRLLYGVSFDHRADVPTSIGMKISVNLNM